MSTHDRAAGSALSGALVGASLFFLLLLFLPRPASGQDDGPAVDPGWLPWLGCWEVVAGSAEGDEGDPPTVCVRPADDGAGVELVTGGDGEITGREVVRADGRRRASTSDGCSGWERGRFSDDGHRVYVRSEHDCPGGVRRTSSSLLAWVSPTEWIEVRAVEVRESLRTWVRRYRLATPDEVAGAGLTELAVEESMATESARVAAARRIRVDDVVEASGHLPGEATAAWIAERSRPLDLDADALLGMADAGVPEQVIDVAIGVTYPDRFSVGPSGAVEEGRATANARYDYDDRRGYRGRRPVRRWYGSRYGGWYGSRYGSWYGRWYGYRPYRFYDPFYYDPFYYPYARSGFGFGYVRGYRPAVVRVVPRSDEGGRVVNGRGYTRDRPEGRRAVPRSGVGSDSSPARTPSARGVGRSTGSGASVSPSGGYRSGGSGSGRTARPRSGSGSGNDGGNGSGDR